MSAIAVTAAQIAQVFSDPSRAETFNVVAAEAVTKGDIVYQTTSGTFGVCDMSTAAKDEPRGMALQAAAAGEAFSMIKYGPVYGVTLSGENYDGPVYAADDGALADTGTMIIGRVMPAADRSKTKVLFIDCREQAVEAGWLQFNNVGFMSAGTWGAPVTSDEAGETFMELWCKCTGAGHVYGRRVNVQVTNIAATTSNAIRAELDLYHASGHAVGGGAAIHAATELGTGNDGHAGLLSGLNASIIASADTRSLQGTYAALTLQTEFKAGNTMPATTSFIYCADAGAVKSPLLLNTAGMASASDGAWETDSGAVGGTVLGYYKVKTAAGDGYIVVYSSHS